MQPILIGSDRDRFILSAGHGSMLLYSILHLAGYPGVELDDLKNFRQVGSKTAGHPEYGHISGAEMTTGPLGQGLTTAVGFCDCRKDGCQLGTETIFAITTPMSSMVTVV